MVLHGGEPLLLGYKGLHALISQLRTALDAVRYPISVQTNGSLLDKRILDLFSEHRVSVSVSIDGPQAPNDLARIDRKGGSTFFKTVQGIDASCCIQTGNFYLLERSLSFSHLHQPRAHTIFLKTLALRTWTFFSRMETTTGCLTARPASTPWSTVNGCVNFLAVTSR